MYAKTSRDYYIISTYLIAIATHLSQSNTGRQTKRAIVSCQCGSVMHTANGPGLVIGPDHARHHVSWLLQPSLVSSKLLLFFVPGPRARPKNPPAPDANRPKRRFQAQVSSPCRGDARGPTLQSACLTHLSSAPGKEAVPMVQNIKHSACGSWMVL